MLAIKRIIKESKFLYLTMFFILILNIALSAVSASPTNGPTLATSIFYGAALASAIFIFVSGKMLVKNNFRLSIIFNTDRLIAIKEIIRYLVFLSLCSSAIINTIGMLIHFLPNSPIIPYLAGFNWNVVDGLFIRFIVVAVALYFIGSLSLLTRTVVSVYGMISGFTVISLVFSLIAALRYIVNDFLLWGTGLVLVTGIFFTISASLTIFSIKTLSRYEIN